MYGRRIDSSVKRMVAVLALGVLFFPALSSAATVTYASNKVMGPTNGLVGYWTMNAQDINWTTGTILDRSGYGNNGILTNMATKTAPYTGKLGQALKFDAVNDAINAGSAVSLDNLPQMTLAFWIRELGSGENGIGNSITKSTGSTPTGGWQLVTQGGVSFVVRTSGTNMSFGTTDTPLSDMKWHHIIVTWDGGILASGVHMYIDGREITSAISIDGIFSRSSDGNFDLVLGNNSVNSRTLNGSLDDVRIYNRILTPSEITQVYKAGQVQLASVSKKNASGLVGWWTFDGKDVNWTTSTALDRSGYGNNGILTNMATKTAPVAGKIGQGLQFRGGYTSWVEAPPSSSLNNLSALTYSAWVNFQKGNFGGYIVGKNERISLSWTPSDYAFNIDCSSNDLYVYGNDPTGYGWHHMAVTWGGGLSTSSVRLYRDGKLVTVNTGTNCAASKNNDITYGMRIGHMNGESFSGSIDDVRVYNRALTSTEVAQLYKEGQVAVNSFTCGVSTVKDVDGNVYNTVKIGTQCWMKQNMRVGTRINGATAQSNNSVIEKYCYNDIASNCTDNHPNHPDGGLYQWNEAMQYSTTPGARGICPAGWHIPTHDEWTTLERAVCTSGSCATDFPYDTTTSGFRGTNEGTKLKANGTSLWEGNLTGDSFASSFENRDAFGAFWSSLGSGGSAWYRLFASGSVQVTRLQSDQLLGFSVRCMKD